MAHRPLRSVAVVVTDGVHPFGLGAMCEVWNEPYHPDDDNPVFDFRVVTPRPGRIRGTGGFDLHVEHDLEFARSADLVIVSPQDDDPERHDEPVLDLLRETHERGARLFAHCTAVYALGAAGLLDGRTCTTHWRHVDRIRSLYPRARITPDVLYVQDGPITTGAGSAAGLDAALHLMRSEFGADVAAVAARRMVVPPHRDGGQAQFISRPVPTCEADTLGPLLRWMVENLAEDLSVERLAHQVHLSPRTFARRFRDETGTTPHAWLVRQRVQAAEALLERSDLTVEQVAHRVGFGNAAALRHHFTRVRGLSPQRYRRTFAAPA